MTQLIYDKLNLSFEPLLVQNLKLRCSEPSTCPSTTLSPSGQLITSQIVIANLFNDLVVSSIITGSNFSAVCFQNRTSVVLDVVSTEPIVLHQYLAHLNKSSSLGLMSFHQLLLKVLVICCLYPSLNVLIFLYNRAIFLIIFKPHLSFLLTKEIPIMILVTIGR